MSEKFISLDNLKEYNTKVKETYIKPLEERVKDCPYEEITAVLPAKTYTFDGNLEGKEVISFEGGATFVKISDDTLNEAQLSGATLVYSSNSTGEKEFIIDEEWFDRAVENIIIYTRNNKSDIAIFSIKNIDMINSDIGETLFSSTGTYFMHSTAGFISQLILNETAISTIPSKTYTFDGNAEGKENITLEDGYQFIKISDDILLKDQINGSVVTYKESGVFQEIVMGTHGEGLDFGDEFGHIYAFVGNSLILAVYDAEQLNQAGYYGTGFTTGIYFSYFEDDYVSQLVTFEYSYQGGIIHQLDEKFIPDTILRSKDLTGDLVANDIPFWDGEKFKPLKAMKTYRDGDQVYLGDDDTNKLALQAHQLYQYSLVTSSGATNDPRKVTFSARGGLSFENFAKRVVYGYDNIRIDPSINNTFGSYDVSKAITVKFPTKSGTVLTTADLDATAANLPKRPGFKPINWCLNFAYNGLLNAIEYENISDSTKKLIVLEYHQTSNETVLASGTSMLGVSIGKWQSGGVNLHEMISILKDDSGTQLYTLQDFPYVSVDSYHWIVKPEDNDGWNFMDAVILSPQIYDAIASNNQATLFGLGVRFNDTNINKSINIAGKNMTVTLQNFI